MHSRIQRRLALRAGLVASACWAALPAWAQAPAWQPDKPIRLLVGFAPGGSSDVVARLMAPKLGKLLGQPVVVENRAGAGGALAADAVAKAPGDGLTWLLAPSGHSTMAGVIETAKKRPLSFSSVGVGTAPHLLGE